MAPRVQEDGSPLCQGLVRQCALQLVLSEVLWSDSDDHILAAWLSNLHKHVPTCQSRLAMCVDGAHPPYIRPQKIQD